MSTPTFTTPPAYPSKGQSDATFNAARSARFVWEDAFTADLASFVPWLEGQAEDAQAAALASISGQFVGEFDSLSEGTLFALNATKDGFDAVQISEYTVTPFAEELLGDADAAEARATLGVAEVLDEDDFASDSADRPPSQQSVSAYVAEYVAAEIADRVQEFRYEFDVDGAQSVIEFTDLEFSRLEVAIYLTAATDMVLRWQVSSDNGATWVQTGYQSAVSTDGAGGSATNGFLVSRTPHTILHSIGRIEEFGTANRCHYSAVGSNDTISEVSSATGRDVAGVPRNAIRLTTGGTITTSGHVIVRGYK